MSEPAIRRGHEPPIGGRSCSRQNPRSLIDAKATCITRSNSTSMRSGNTGHRRGAEFAARMIRGSGFGACVTSRAAPSTRNIVWAVPLFL